jgi:hypothetical protein
MPAVWAYSKAAPGKTCEDARLLGGGTKLQYPEGNEKGQAGWDAGLMFDTFGDLAEKLRKLDNGPITRLAINLHGSPGKIDALSGGIEASMFDFKQLWSRYSSQLVAINGMLAAGAPVLIMGCNVAKGKEGEEFLSELSKNAFKSRKVVGFSTIGETLGQFRNGGFCTEPGMRDTPYDNPSAGKPKVQEEREKEYLNLPWASETSPHAKVAMDGKIISGAEAPVPQTSYAPADYLPGTWSVSIGDWQGYFLFKTDGTASWAEASSPGNRHQGKWSTAGGTVEWSFSDDAPGWKRSFTVATPLKSTLNGNITISGRPHGFFTMSKQM